MYHTVPARINKRLYSGSVYVLPAVSTVIVAPERPACQEVSLFPAMLLRLRVNDNVHPCICLSVISCPYIEYIFSTLAARCELAFA